MELRNLNTFVRAADAGSFSRAASELGYTQSTVTAQIQGLEEELGVQLFDRLPKGIALTQPGEALWSTPGICFWKRKMPGWL